jgi:hypothetical protein
MVNASAADQTGSSSRWRARAPLGIRQWLSIHPERLPQPATR